MVGDVVFVFGKLAISAITRGVHKAFESRALVVLIHVHHGSVHLPFLGPFNQAGR